MSGEFELINGREQYFSIVLRCTIKALVKGSAVGALTDSITVTHLKAALSPHPTQELLKGTHDTPKSQVR